MTPSTSSQYRNDVCMPSILYPSGWTEGERERERESAPLALRHRRFQSQMVEADGLAFALLFG